MKYYRWFRARRPITLVEVPPFPRQVAACLSEKDLDDFKFFIATHPRAGTRLRGTGGLRKLRWATGSRGKSGGVRVVYYYHDDSMPLFLLSVFAKSGRESLTAQERKCLRQLARQIVATYRNRRGKP